MKHTELIKRLRGVVQKLRRTPMPIADIAPMTNEAADAIESLQAEVERLNSQQVPDWFKEQVMAVQAERDASKLDAKRLQRIVLVISEGWTSLPPRLANQINEAMKGAA